MAKKGNSRPARWAAACAQLRAALDAAQAGRDDLRSLQEEYEEWRDNLPENMQSSAVYDKLDTICNIDVEDALSEFESMVDEAEGADLPQGFGRD